MAISDEYQAFVLESLSRVTPVTGRRMFGGLGIYADGFFFALADDDALYFKVDDATRRDFEAIGCGPFRPYGPEGQAMQYYELPGELLEDVEALRPWVEKAVGVARAARAGKRRR